MSDRFSGLARRTRFLRQRALPRVLLIILLALCGLMLFRAARAGLFAALTPARTVGFALAAALFVFSYAPLIGGVWTSGMLPTALAGLFWMGSALFFGRIAQNRVLSVLFFGTTALITAAALLCILTAARMFRVSQNTVPDGDDSFTAVVLGCRIRGRIPSRMLAGRLECARRYLAAHPGAMCVVSGGQGIDEPCPEAEIMREVLLSRGIAPERVIVEPRSASTRENLEFSLELMRGRGLPPRVAVVSDRFHQYRAVRLGSALGAECRSVNRRTAWYLVLPYWLREIVGVLLTRV